MNLHINKEEFDYLIKQPYNIKVTVGSKLYGLDDEYSDIDYLIITPPFINKNFSPFNNHHQFQYKDIENNIDYNFVDIITFIHNLVSGDSTINFELLYSKEFEDSDLGWLCMYKKFFHTYNIMKSYLGLMDRDIRHFGKRTGRDRMSGLLHIMRGGLFARNLINNQSFTLELDFLKDTKPFLKEEKFIKLKSEQLPAIREEGKFLRQTLNDKIKELPRYLDSNIQMLINKNLISLYKDFNDIYLPDSLMLKLFNANEQIEITY